jgi:putative transposase
MDQIGRNLIDDHEGFVRQKRFLIHDRDPLFTKEFGNTLRAAGVRSVKLPPRSPNLNAHAERFVRSIKEECLERMIIFGERGFRIALREYVEHYHFERNHQGLNNQILVPCCSVSALGAVQRKQHLGGLLNHYYREAA